MQMRVRRKMAVFCLLSSVVGSAWLFFCFFNSQLMNSWGIDVHEDPPAYTQPLVSGKPNGGLRVVHLDLKGAPPRLSFLRALLPLLAAQGCNALLLEYEDMFPYSGRLANLSAKNAYSKSDVTNLLMWAHDEGMEVIPLVQTFGHMEFALKLEEFKEMRELSAFPQEVCPSRPGALDLVEEMVSQVMHLHPGSSYLHIGCDEVFHLAACRACTARRLTSREIYSDYVTRVAQMVRRRYPKVTPIIWDDMIRQWPPQFISTSPLTSLVEPMVWVYTQDVSKLLPHYVWHWYGKSFPRVWVAGAFKGATYPTSVLPDMERHYLNQLSWMRFAQGDKPEVTGFVLTGWSRYDHFAVLCELLPTALPSLLLGLTLISSEESHRAREEDTFSRWRKALKCHPSSTFSVYTLKHDQRQLLSSCKFPGIDLYDSVLRFVALKGRVDHTYDSMTETNGWMTEYNLRHNYTSPWRLVEGYSSLTVNTLRQDVRAFRSDVTLKLHKYYDEPTAEEWLEQKVQPMEDKLKRLDKLMESLIRRDVWPRRPLEKVHRPQD